LSNHVKHICGKLKKCSQDLFHANDFEIKKKTNASDMILLLNLEREDWTLRNPLFFAK